MCVQWILTAKTVLNSFLYPAPSVPSVTGHCTHRTLVYTDAMMSLKSHYLIIVNHWSSSPINPQIYWPIEIWTYHRPLPVSQFKHRRQAALTNNTGWLTQHIPEDEEMVTASAVCFCGNVNCCHRYKICKLKVIRMPHWQILPVLRTLIAEVYMCRCHCGNIIIILSVCGGSGYCWCWACALCIELIQINPNTIRFPPLSVTSDQSQLQWSSREMRGM